MSPQKSAPSLAPIFPAAPPPSRSASTAVASASTAVASAATSSKPQKSKSRVKQPKEYIDPGVKNIASRVRDIEDKWRAENRVPYEKPWYIVDPRSSRALGYWDACTSLALLFTAIFTPIEVGFIPMPEDR